eukprot:m.55853 g.55853  ORF g.55853 m.55853 type:complete len:637 (-) comp7637_c0_seq1:59-1969(-)
MADGLDQPRATGARKTDVGALSVAVRTPAGTLRHNEGPGVDRVDSIPPKVPTKGLSNTRHKERRSRSSVGDMPAHAVLAPSPPSSDHPGGSRVPTSHATAASLPGPHDNNVTLIGGGASKRNGQPFLPHPTEGWVLDYLRERPSGRRSVSDVFETAANTFLARYETVVHKGGPAAEIPSTLRGLSLLVGCVGAVRTRAADIASAVLALPASANDAVIPSFFSFARDMVVLVAGGPTLDANDDNAVLTVITMTAIRLAGAHRLGALQGFDRRDLAQFADMCKLLESAVSDDVLPPLLFDVRAAIASTMTAFDSLRHNMDDDGVAPSSLRLAVDAVSRHRAPRDARGRGGGACSRRADAVTVLAAIDTEVDTGDVLGAELGLRVLGLHASMSVAAASELLRLGGTRLRKNVWPRRLVHVYCQTLSRMALGGQTSKIRRMVLDPAVVGSLAPSHHANDPWHIDYSSLGADAMNLRWAIVHALLTIKFGGAKSMAYSWLSDAANMALLSRADVDDTTNAVSALDQRARAHSSLLLSAAGPFGLENTLCATSWKKPEPPLPIESSPTVRLPSVRSRAPPTRTAPVIIHKLPVRDPARRPDIVTRSTAGLRALLGQQVDQRRQLQGIRNNAKCSPADSVLSN